MSRANGRTPPGPKGKPVVGSLPEFSRDALQMFTDAWREYGDVLQFRLGPRIIYLLVKPEHLKYILEDRAMDYFHPKWFDSRFRAVAGHGVITKRKEAWLHRRQALEPCFEHTRLPPLDEPFADGIAAELDRWRPDAEAGTARIIKDDVYNLSVTILGRVLLGSDWDRHAGSVLPSVRTFLNQIDRLLNLPFNVPARVPLPANFRYNAARRRYDKAVAAAIDSKRSGSSDGLLAALTELGEAHDGLGDEEIRNELTHAYMAGWTTMAATMMWGCYLLGLHPEIADALRAEAGEVLGDRAPTSADLERMPYNTRVVDEVLRLYPPLWAGARAPLEDDEIDGYHVPAETFVNFSSYVTHRHPEYWSEPEKFDPDRWLPERGEPKSPYAYLPFSYGPRSCLGADVARTALRFFAPMLVQRYRLRTVEDHPIEHTLGITISSKHGVKVVLSPA